MNKIIPAALLLFILGGVSLINIQSTRLNTSNSVQDNISNSVLGAGKINLPEGAYFYKINNESSVSYVVLKKFLSKPEQHITGTASEVTGDGWYDHQKKKGFVQAYVDIRNIHTDNEKRDEDVLRLFKDPMVRFSSDIAEFPITLSQSFSSDVKGQITLNGITRDVVFEVSGTVTQQYIEAEGRTVVKMSDFDINPPSLAGVFTADNDMELKFAIKADRLN